MNIEANRKLVCSGCGATIEYSIGLQSIKCRYCDLLNEIETTSATEVSTNESESEVIIRPLKFPVTLDDQNLKNYLLFNMRRLDLVEEFRSKLDLKIEKFSVPVYRYKIKYRANWTATFGYGTKDSDFVDWRPLSGTANREFDSFLYVGEGLEKYVAQNRLDSFFDNVKLYLELFEIDTTASSELICENACYDNPNYKLIVESDVEKRYAQGNKRPRDWVIDISELEVNPLVFELQVPICDLNFTYDNRDYHVIALGFGEDKLLSSTDRRLIFESDLKTIQPKNVVPAKPADDTTKKKGFFSFLR